MEKQAYLTSVQWGFIVARAWSDRKFRERLEIEPTSTIREYAKEELEVEVERVFQIPSPPQDLAAEPLSLGAHGAAGSILGCICACTGTGGATPSCLLGCICACTG